MASSSEIARRYFDALSRRDLDAAAACWAAGGTDRLVGQFQLTAPEGVVQYFQELFDAFPDFSFEVVDTTTYRDRCAVRWRARGTFAGPGRFQGFVANGAKLAVEGCDLLTVVNGLIVAGEVYTDTGDLARQLGLLPPVGSTAEARLARLQNARTRIRNALGGATPEAIAAGVWVVRGGRPRTMNVFLLEDDGGVTLFDAGVAGMATSLAAAAARLGGIRRVVLGHADADHRGAAPRLEAPVYCHPQERLAAESPSSFRDYWDLSKLSSLTRPVYTTLLRHWDGGPVEIAGTVEEGDVVAGFRVIELPGHAPGQIGLFRESDRLALVSDCFRTLDVQTGIRRAADVPHAAFNQNTDQARESIRKLAELQPAAAWPGHARPVVGPNVQGQLQHAVGHGNGLPEAL
jgi:hydroxyacylglutathione hydrolase